MYDLIYTDKVASPSAVTDTYDALNQKFKEGKYAMIFQWSYRAGFWETSSRANSTLFPCPPSKQTDLVAGCISPWRLREEQGRGKGIP
jgi:ABC-type glycerol-3-phosphate transport system substrate-binding protein